ncbi:MAG: cytochrome c3 [Gemmatimonadetes bacterium]|nr:cytochrome c3 [Gemmatimonadota bacterium]
MVPGFVVLTSIAAIVSAYTGARQQQATTPDTAAGSAVRPSARATNKAPDTVIVNRGEWGYWGGSTPQGRSPTQPIAFPHPRHVQTLGMNCLYCHFSANKAMDPGLPAVSTCMGCHTVVTAQRPATDGLPARTSEGIQKLTTYWQNKQPIPWVRVHKVPDYVQFPHMRHVNAGVTCQTCHGQVQQMTRVYQYAPLNMGWCINCHIGNVNPAWKARYDCSTCHY